MGDVIDELGKYVPMEPRRSYPVVIVTPERIAALEAENTRLREACEPLYHTEWPHRVFDIVVDKDFALAEQFAGVMHDIHAALEPLP